MERDVRLRARRAAARGIPPRLPADEVEVLPFFGRTWYEHGVAYWLRRVVMVLIASIALAVATCVVIGTVSVISKIGSPIARWAWRLVLAAVMVASLDNPIRALRVTRQARREGWLTAPSESDWEPHPTGVLKALVRIRDVLARVWFIGAVLCYGWLVYFLILTLQPEFGEEAFARLRLQVDYSIATGRPPPGYVPPGDAADPRRGIERTHDRTDHSGDDHDLRPRRRPDRGLPRRSKRHHTARRGRGDPPHARL